MRMWALTLNAQGCWRVASWPLLPLVASAFHCIVATWKGDVPLRGTGKVFAKSLSVTQRSEFVPQDQFVSLFHDCRAGLWLLSAAFQKSQEWIINLCSSCLAVSGVGTLSPFISCEVSPLGSSPMIPLQLDNA